MLRFQATVLLAVNVSFLAIPDATPIGDAVTTGFVASLCSTVTSIGCIVVGLLLVNEDHTNPKADQTVSIFARSCAASYCSSSLLPQVLSFMKNLKSDKFEYEPLAILYALPYALLMWR